ncbi:Eukaryotic translation initiation factor 4 gamma 3 [Armadillidium nasatum]|uniref:Eukaryotic translation initiation factor 4 gamma 3 n=1 Tax=Armadillidium nasatum TaxID=96803 RepID=A0A5N5TE95_9CRUS|nr:Eukaryotic translation initiation factor 4 gamma 3 [Armadillidium nasatum]
MYPMNNGYPPTGYDTNGVGGQFYYNVLAPMAQHRQGASTNHQQFAATQMMAPTPNHYPIQYSVQGYTSYVENPKSWTLKNQFAPAPIYFTQPQNKPPPSHAPLPSREKKVIPIVDPATNKNILEDMALSSKGNDNTTTPIQSRDSSTANTPAPGDVVQRSGPNNHLATEFARSVINRMTMGDETNEQPEPIECMVNPNKTIESSHIEKSDNDNRISSVDNKNETVNKINQKVAPVPEHSGIKSSKTEQPAIQSTQSLNTQISQNDNNSGLSSQNQGPLQQPPPPQPQRPAKQPRGGQHQNSQKGGGNQQQTSNKQPSPQQSSKSQSKNSGNHASQKGMQAPQVQQQQQQQPKRGASPNAQNSKNHNNQNVTKNLPQPHQAKLAADNLQAAKVQPPHAHLGSNQVPPQQNTCQSPRDQVVAHHQLSNTSQQQRLNMQGQNLRGPSPPNQNVSQGAPRKLSGEIPIQASAAPIKQSEKLPSPNLEQIPNVNIEVQKDPSPNNKHVASKNASGFAPLSVAVPKKEKDVESTQTPVDNVMDGDSKQGSRRKSKKRARSSGQKYGGRQSVESLNGKRGGKDRNANDVQQPKENKELPSKTSVEEAPPKPAENSSNQKKEQQLSHKHKPQSTNNSNKDAAITNPPQASQQPPKQKSESPVQEQEAKVASSVAAVQAPEAISHEISKSFSPRPPKTVPVPLPLPVEAELNHVEEIKVNNHEENHVSDKPKSSSLKYSYQEGQWSPENQEGKRQYNREFLIEMSKNPLSMKRPDSLPNLEVVLDHTPHRTLGKYGTRNSLQGQKKGSNMGNMNMGSVGGLCDGPRVIAVNLNITERQLKTTENAWKPSARKELNEDESIVRKMRGILNKLTPDNFEKLTVQITKFKIVEFGTFDSVIGLIFEKAVDEQAFSKTYADLCKVLSQLSIKVKTEKEKEGGEARFRNLLINKCQQEFEKDNSKDLQKEERLKKIAESNDPEYKAELKALLEYDERRLRKRSVGNIRFIGELYKNRMLTSSIMMRIICGLLLKKDEESLECLCKLVSTIGYMLEPQSQASQKAQAEFSEVFTTLRKIVDERKTSSRVRFMIMDLIDQRKNQWVRRREDAKPKKKAEVHEEIRKEELEQQYLLASAPKRDDRERKRSRDTRGLMTDDNGWNTVICSRRTMFDSSRLKSQTFNRNNNDNDPPVFSAKFSNWATGSTGGSKNHEEESSRPFINRFAPLELTPMMDMRRSNPMGKLAPGGMNTTHRQGNSFGSKSMPPPSEKEGIHYSKMSSASGDRSKSNSRSSSRQSSRDNSMAREATSTYRDVQKPVQQKPPLDRNMVEKYANGLLEEYYSINDINEAVLLKPVLEMLSDYVIDIPQVFSYVGGILCRLLVDNVASLENILTILEPCEKKMDVFAKVIKEASVVLMEASVIELWESSKINLKALLPEDLSVNEYLTKHEIQFISEASSSECSVVAGEDMPIDAKLIRIELCKLFKSKVPDEEIFDWIEKHIGSKTNTKTFIRALTTALIESLLLRTDGNSYVTIEDFSDKLKEKGKFIRKYVDNNQDLELACIYAMQALCVECQHPPGLLEKAFNALYDIEVLIDDSFYQWEKSDDPEGQFGKGVCLTSVKKFLDWLRDEPDPTDSGMDDV